MSVFHYPKSRHSRAFKPPNYADYRKYKSYLRKEFSGTCVYCRMPDRLRTYDSFGVDHYRPKSRFPEFAATYTNLFYACNTCNRRKGEFWPSRQQRDLSQFVPNPCDHVMFEHLRFRHDGIVDHHSPAGEWTLDLLIINEPEQIDFRKAIVGAAGYAEETCDQLRRTIEELRKREESGSEADRRRLAARRQTREIELEEASGILSTLTGR